MRVHDRDRVRAGLAVDRDADRRLAVPGSEGLVVLDVVDHVGDVGEANRRAVAIGQDLLPELGRLVELAFGVNDRRPRPSVQLSGGEIDVDVADRAGDLVDADAADGESGRVDLDAHGRTRLSEDQRFGDAVDRGQFSDQQILDVLIDDPKRQRLRTDVEEKDRTFGRIDLAQRRRRRHVARQRARGRRGRRLNVLERGVDVAVETELQRDAGLVLAALRGHRIETRDQGELLLQRRGHGRRHGLGIGAGQSGLHFDGREIDVGQFADGKGEVAVDARNHERCHQQRRHHRTPDEGSRDVHRGVLFLSAARAGALAAALRGGGRVCGLWPGGVLNCGRPVSPAALRGFRRWRPGCRASGATGRRSPRARRSSSPSRAPR